MSKSLGYKYSGTKGHIANTIKSLPKNPKDLLKRGWKNISHQNEEATGHIKMREANTGLIIRFDKHTVGASGFRGKDHYHIFNPNAKSRSDLCLDKNNQPCADKSAKSHILV